MPLRSQCSASPSSASGRCYGPLTPPSRSCQNPASLRSLRPASAIPRRIGRLLGIVGQQLQHPAIIPGGIECARRLEVSVKLWLTGKTGRLGIERGGGQGNLGRTFAIALVAHPHQILRRQQQRAFCPGVLGIGVEQQLRVDFLDQFGRGFVRRRGTLQHPGVSLAQRRIVPRQPQPAPQQTLRRRSVAALRPGLQISRECQQPALGRSPINFVPAVVAAVVIVSGGLGGGEFHSHQHIGSGLLHERITGPGQPGKAAPRLVPAFAVEGIGGLDITEELAAGLARHGRPRIARRQRGFGIVAIAA